jgi:hypothetical protein
MKYAIYFVFFNCSFALSAQQAILFDTYYPYGQGTNLAWKAVSISNGRTATLISYFPEPSISVLDVHGIEIGSVDISLPNATSTNMCMIFHEAGQLYYMGSFVTNSNHWLGIVKVFTDQIPLRLVLHDSSSISSVLRSDIRSIRKNPKTQKYEAIGDMIAPLSRDILANCVMRLDADLKFEYHEFIDLGEPRQVLNHIYHQPTESIMTIGHRYNNLIDKQYENQSEMTTTVDFRWKNIGYFGFMRFTDCFTDSLITCHGYTSFSTFTSHLNHFSSFRVLDDTFSLKSVVPLDSTPTGAFFYRYSVFDREGNCFITGVDNAGEGTNTMVVIKYDNKQKLVAKYNYSKLGKNLGLSGITLDELGNPIVFGRAGDVGVSNSAHGVVIKFGKDIFTNTIDQPDTEPFINSAVFPNPSSGDLWVKSRSEGLVQANMYAIDGGMIKQFQLQKGQIEHHLRVSELLLKGMYLLECRYDDGRVDVHKVVFY